MKDMPTDIVCRRDGKPMISVMGGIPLMFMIRLHTTDEDLIKVSTAAMWKRQSRSMEWLFKRRERAMSGKKLRY